MLTLWLLLLLRQHQQQYSTKQNGTLLLLTFFLSIEVPNKKIAENNNKVGICIKGMMVSSLFLAPFVWCDGIINCRLRAVKKIGRKNGMEQQFMHSKKKTQHTQCLGSPGSVRCDFWCETQAARANVLCQKMQNLPHQCIIMRIRSFRIFFYLVALKTPPIRKSKQWRCS